MNQLKFEDIVICVLVVVTSLTALSFSRPLKSTDSRNKLLITRFALLALNLTVIGYFCYLVSPNWINFNITKYVNTEDFWSKWIIAFVVTLLALVQSIKSGGAVAIFCFLLSLMAVSYLGCYKIYLIN
ncbi:MAG: hypothetical protein HQK81_06975 [Desulfovibrionaceae bacterium]|nr:hypothetical protein [Desulfovibrionaceae bacterium]MBF0513793.1 hypothetical protein [Desulfovibrionaceae bacterium]